MTATVERMAVSEPAARRSFFSFPDPVNEVAVRTTAAGVALMAAAMLATQRPEILLVIAYGFVARALAGPRISPLALLVTKVVVPRLPFAPRPVPGPPKRFAQGMGATVSVLAAVSWYALGWHAVTDVLVSMMVVLATLESSLGICVGCIVHAWLARRRWIKATECAECADVARRLGVAR
jgi:hypothetical protein